MSATKHKLGKAKAALVIEQPFIASIVCALPLVEDENLYPPTLATDGEHIRFHPSWIEEHTEKEVMWALGHETMHCVFKHMLNRGARQPRRWNIAADYVINYLLEQDMPRCRPKGVYFDEDIYKRGNGTTEGVYNLLPPDEDGDGGKSGQPQPWDMVEDFKGDASEAAEVDARWKVKIAQAASVAKMHGKLNKELERMIGDLLEPKVPWEDVLRKFCLRQTRSDRSFARPSRRHLHTGDYLPGLSGVGMGDIMVGVDVSGSITVDELQRFLTEMKSIKEDACPANTHVIYFHHAVCAYDVFTQDDELHLTKTGSGGTAFSPVFRYAAEHGIQPDCCVMLTDLHCSDFGPHPDYPVLWVSTGAQTAPWGEIIPMREGA